MTIRFAKNTKQDSDLVFFLSNDPLVRSCSFNTNTIECEQHCKWFAKTVADGNTLFFLVFEDNDFVGQIRFNRESERAVECMISLSIAEQFRGKHLAKEFLELGIGEMRKNWHNIRTVVAEVKGENASSNAIFRKEGFELISQINIYKLSVSPNMINGGG